MSTVSSKKAEVEFDRWKSNKERRSHGQQLYVLLFVRTFIIHDRTLIIVFPWYYIVYKVYTVYKGQTHAMLLYTDVCLL